MSRTQSTPSHQPQPLPAPAPIVTVTTSQPLQVATQASLLDAAKCAAKVIAEDLLDSSAQYSTKDCAVHVISDDCIEVVFRIEGQDLRRYKSRMSNGRNWAEYLWSMVLKRAIISHVY